MIRLPDSTSKIPTLRSSQTTSTGHEYQGRSRRNTRSTSPTRIRKTYCKIPYLDHIQYEAWVWQSFKLLPAAAAAAVVSARRSQSPELYKPFYITLQFTLRSATTSTTMLFHIVLQALLASSAVLARPAVDSDLVAREGQTTDATAFKGTRWTWYDVGLGACGRVSHPKDFVVALNADQFGPGFPGPPCFQKTKMSHKGKKATAMIVDKCPGCPKGGLDLSKGLFKHFAPLSTGVIQGKWHFVKKNHATGEGGNGTDTSDMEIELV